MQSFATSADQRRRKTLRRSSGTAVVSASSSSTTSSAASSSASAGGDREYLALKGIQVYPATRKGSKKPAAPVDLLSLFRAAPEDRTALVFLTHGGDLAPQELVPRLAKRLPSLRAQGVKVLVFLMGTPENAAAFAETVGLGGELGGEGGALFFADPTAAAYDALGFSKGFDPELPIVGKGALPGWVRTGLMLAGLGSPGTMQEVARGYLGDRSAPPIFEGSGPFDILGKNYQRPMELATLRLNSMVTVLSQWKDLAPPDPALLPRLGGALVLRGRRTVFRHDDGGILKYCDLDALVRAASDERALPKGREE